MAKILIINLPASGHVNPTIPLTKELVDRGHEVTYLLSEDFKEKIAPTGSKFISYVMISDKDATKYLNSSEDKDMKSIVTNIYETALRIGKDYYLIIYEFIFTMEAKLASALNKPAIQ